MTEIFKAYDIRGVYPTDINEEIAYKIGRAFVLFTKAKTIIVGRDARLSSPNLFKALTDGITDQGANVIDIKECSTPMFYFGSKDAEASIMVTASHNPKEYNGFKLCKNNAIPISGDNGIQDIKKLIKNNFPETTKGNIKQKDIVNEFIKFNKQFLKTKKQFKIVLDAANGMAGFTLPKIFKEFDNIELIELYTDIDFNFPNHEANPMKEENLKDIKNKVLETKADLGIATDGDGDRIVFIDEKGNNIPSDLTTALIAESLLKEQPGSTILYDLRSSKITKETIEKNGKASMCRVGHSFIKKQMRDENAIFAGELSGHLYFKAHNYTESSFLAAAYILNLMENAKLSELTKPLKKYFQSGEINSEVKDKEKTIEKIKEKYNGKQLNLDGLSVYYENWWFNLRASNTEPLLRLNLEANTKELLKQKKTELLALIRE